MQCTKYRIVDVPLKKSSKSCPIERHPMWQCSTNFAKKKTYVKRLIKCEKGGLVERRTKKTFYSSDQGFVYI